MRIYVKFFLFIFLVPVFGAGIISSCGSPEKLVPDKTASEFFIKAEINGEKKSYLSKVGYSLLIPSTPVPTLILRANEGYSKIREVPGFELNLSFQNFPPAPGVYLPAYSENNFITYNFFEGGELKTASSKMRGSQTKIILKDVIPEKGGFILQGTFFGKVQAKEGNSIWEFDLRHGSFRVFASTN